jgi:activating signal cointegrator complex subunit 2
MPTIVEVVPLPTYPSASVRKSLSASQLATLHRNISGALTEILVLPPAKRDTATTRNFLSSYTNDIAHQTLQSLIWQAPPYSDDHVHRRVLLLAEKLATSPSSLDAKTLLDIAIAYFPYPTRVRALFAAALSSTPNLVAVFASDMVPALTTLLTPSRSAGLYGLRKTARCLISLLSGCPPELVRPFSKDQGFMIALARAYDEGLASLARSYGGLRMDVVARELDDWERIWLETKIDLIDSFHILVTVMLQDLLAASGLALAEQSERTFSVVFALLDLPSPPAPVQVSGTASSYTPFLSRSLLADYQHSYNLAGTLTSALHRAAREDARIDLLESTLRSYDIESSTGTKDPGALKLIIKSSGAPIGTSTSGKGKAAQSQVSSKGKSIDLRSAPEPAPNHDLDLQISQVMDIFPDQSPAYIQALLTNPAFPYRGNAEKVIEALLEGTAPGEDVLTKDVTMGTSAQVAFDEPIERRNIFDDEILDVTKIHVGKRT